MYVNYNKVSGTIISWMLIETQLIYPIA